MDWVCALISLGAWWLMAKHRRKAVVILAVNGMLWIVFLSSVAMWSLVVLQLCYLVANIWTLRAWRVEA